MNRTDIVVIGAGLIGSSVAWRLAQHGHRVTVVEKGEPGVEASWAAAGLLQPEAGREAGPQLLQLWLNSLANYGAFIAEIREVTGIAVEYRTTGRLVAAFDEVEEAALREKFQAQAGTGIRAEWLGNAAVRALESAVAPDIRGAILYSDHGLVDNRQLTSAVVQAARRAGVTLRTYETVTAIQTSGGRVSGVRTDRGVIPAEIVINAAGAWSAGLGLQDANESRVTILSPSDPPVYPAKGEIIALQARPRPLERVITIPGGSVSARADGRIVVGATVRDVGFDREITADGVARMLTAAIRAVPELKSARFLEAWTGLRPRTPDEQPVLGEGRVPGLFWATGHFKMGILSAPATAEVLTALVEGREPPFPVDDLTPWRFGM